MHSLNMPARAPRRQPPSPSSAFCAKAPPPAHHVHEGRERSGTSMLEQEAVPDNPLAVLHPHGVSDPDDRNDCAGRR